MADTSDRTLRAVKGAIPARVAELGGVPLSEYDLGQHTDPEPVCGAGLAYRGYVSILAGREGEGKSTLAAQLAAAVTAGRASWMGDGDDPRERRPVAWITGDGHQAQTAAAIKQCGGHLGLVVTFDVDAVATPGDLREICQALRPALLVADPLLDLLRPRDERSYSQAREALRSWRPPVLWGKRGRVWEAPAMLGITHEPKTRDRGRGDRIIDSIGSVGLNTAADLLLSFRGDAKLESTRRTLEVRKSRINSLPRGATTWLDFDLETRRYRQIDEPARPKVSARPDVADDEIRARVVAWHEANPGRSQNAMLRELRIAKGTRRYRVAVEAFRGCRATG